MKTVFSVYIKPFILLWECSVCVPKCVFMCLCLCVCVCVCETGKESSLYTFIDMIKLSSMDVTIYLGYLYFNILIQSNHITLYLSS